jgi:hypothetical protein
MALPCLEVLCLSAVDVGVASLSFQLFVARPILCIPLEIEAGSGSGSNLSFSFI